MHCLVFLNLKDLGEWQTFSMLNLSLHLRIWLQLLLHPYDIDQDTDIWPNLVAVQRDILGDSTLSAQDRRSQVSSW
jgi:hypothetical protein